MKRLIVIVFLKALCSFILHSQTLEIHQLDVGNADAAVIIAKNAGGGIEKTVLLDGGGKGKKNDINDFLKSYSPPITTIDFMIASHYHSDHVGGLSTILSDLEALGLTVTKVYDRGDLYSGTTSYKSAVSSNFRAKAINHERETITPGEAITLFADSDAPSIVMTCVAVNGSVLSGPNTSIKLIPDNVKIPNENDLSTAFQISYGKFKYFTGGDIGGKDKKEPGTCSGAYDCSAYFNIETKVSEFVKHTCALKVNHHGSRCSTNDDFITNLNPKVAVISSGKHGAYKHPKQEVLNTLNHWAHLDHYYATGTNHYKGVTASPGGTPKGTFVGGNVSIIVRRSTDGNDIGTESRFWVETWGTTPVAKKYICIDSH